MITYVNLDWASQVLDSVVLTSYYVVLLIYGRDKLSFISLAGGQPPPPDPKFVLLYVINKITYAQKGEGKK